MDTRRQQIEELFHAARGQPREERAAFLQRSCGGDIAMWHEIESLLASDAETEGPVDRPAWDGAGSPDSSSDMLLSAGATLGPYKITGLLDSGGIGQGPRHLCFGNQARGRLKDIF